MFQILYVCLMIIFIGYLVVATRKVDLFLIAGIGVTFFTVPLLSNSVVEIASSTGLPSAIEREVYASFILVVGALLSAAIVNDLTLRPVHVKPAPSGISTRSLRRFVYAAAGVWVAFLLICISQYGSKLFVGQSKRDLMDSAGLALLFLNTSSVIAAIAGLTAGAWPWKVFAVTICLTMLVIGFRAPLAITALGTLVILFRNRPPISLGRRYTVRGPVGVIVGVAGLALAKPTYAILKGPSGLSGVLDFYSSLRLEDLGRGLEYSTTQSLFNSFVTTGFVTDGGHILRAPLSLLPIPRGLYTTGSNEFNAIFQSTLFPGHESGLAANSVAEFYVAFGMVGVVFYAIAFALATLFLNRGLMRAGGLVTILIAIIGIYLCFYSYRNSLGVTLGFFRNYMIIFGICMFYAVSRIRRRRIPN